MNTPNPSSLVRFVDTSNLARFIVFSINRYHFALPIGQVLRIMSRPIVPQNSYSELGLIQINRHLIKIINLQQQLHTNSELASSSILHEHQPILVIIRNSQSELYGILVSTPPDLLDISPAQIQPLPSPTAYSSPPELISSALIMPAQAESPAIFLLDLQRLLLG